MSSNFMYDESFGATTPSSGTDRQSSSAFDDSSVSAPPSGVSRQQYRVALTQQLRVGLERNHHIDLRDARHEVVVAYADESILPTWRALAISEAVMAHLFVAPTDFESGRLTMLTLAEGRPELSASDMFVDGDTTFGALVASLREATQSLPAISDSQRINVIKAPDSVYHDGLAYSFAFSQLIDV